MAEKQSFRALESPPGRVPRAHARRTPVRGTPPINMGVLPGLIIYMLRQSQLRVNQEFQHATAAENIRPPQFSILEIVHCNPGIRPSDVSSSVGISRANLVPLLSDLELRGWIIRKGDKTDGRAQALHLSRTGTAQLEKLHTLVLPQEDHIAAHLGPQGRDHLLSLLHTLVEGPARETK